MLIQIFWSKKTGDVIVPTVAKTEAGYWLSIEPVECASWNDLQAVIGAVRKAISRAGQVIPTPSRQNFPKPVVLPYSNAKTINEFERKYDMVSLSQSSLGNYSIERYRKAPEGTGGVFDPDASTTYPLGTSLEEVISSLSSSIQLKTR